MNLNDHFSLMSSHQDTQGEYPSVIAAVAILIPITTFMLYLIWRGIRRLVK